ncbi:MAG: IS1595 family transposase [Ktedonobacteraceae bacterium]
MVPLPKSLKDAIVYFSDQDVAIEFLRDVRWPDGVECPTCGSKEVYYISTQRRWKCKNVHAKQQFSVKVGTIFEDSPIGLDKWLPAVWLVTSCKNGISSYELARDLGVTQRTAWFMLHRIRHAMRVLSFEKMSGEIEADESFIGGKVKNMHKRSKRRIKANNDGNWGKTVVLGLLQRGGEARAIVAPNRKTAPVHGNVLDNVERGAALYTDEADVYKQLGSEFVHTFVDHISNYVNGRVHTNGMENFWSLLKRTLGGTYVSVDPVHLFRYLDEQCFRFNKRHLSDAERFVIVLAQAIHRRLTYDELTGRLDTPLVQA